jgi:hypothetical protein
MVGLLHHWIQNLHKWGGLGHFKNPKKKSNFDENIHVTLNPKTLNLNPKP